MAAHDRIRLTGLLRRSPAIAGFLYMAVRQGLVTFALDGGTKGKRRIRKVFPFEHLGTSD
jgi:hypothetical protein